MPYRVVWITRHGGRAGSCGRGRGGVQGRQRQGHRDCRYGSGLLMVISTHYREIGCNQTPIDLIGQLIRFVVRVNRLAHARASRFEQVTAWRDLGSDIRIFRFNDGIGCIQALFRLPLWVREIEVGAARTSSRGQVEIRAGTADTKRVLGACERVRSLVADKGYRHLFLMGLVPGFR